MAWKRNEVIVEHDDREESSFSPLRSRLRARGEAKSFRGAFLLISTCGDTLSGGPVSSLSNTRYRFSVGRLPARRERSRLAKDTRNGGNLTVNVSFARVDEESLRISQSLATDGVIQPPRDFYDNWKIFWAQLSTRSWTYLLYFFVVRLISKLLLFYTAIYRLHTPAVNNL